MRDKIWRELYQTKFGDLYLVLYIDRQKNIKKWYKILTLVFSSSGIFGWKVSGLVPVISCVLIAIMQLFNLIENQIFISDKELSKIIDLRMKYLEQFHNLEKLWTLYDKDEISEKEATNKLFELKRKYESIAKLDNNLDIRLSKSLKSKADIQASNYFNHLY